MGPAAAGPVPRGRAIVERAVSLWLRHIGLYLGVSLLSLLPSMLTTSSTASVSMEQLFVPSTPGAWLRFALETALTGLASGFLVHLTLTLLAGLPADPRRSLGRLSSRAVLVIVVFWMQTLLSWSAFAPLGLGALLDVPWLVGLGMAVALPLVILVSIRFCVVLPATMVEPVRNPLVAFRRSWRLTSGWPAFFALFVVGLLLIGAAFALALAIIVVAGALGAQGPEMLAMALVGTLFGSLLPAVAAVSYQDLRCYKEGGSAGDWLDAEAA